MPVAGPTVENPGVFSTAPPGRATTRTLTGVPTNARPVDHVDPLTVAKPNARSRENVPVPMTCEDPELVVRVTFPSATATEATTALPASRTSTRTSTGLVTSSRPMVPDDART